MQDQSNLNKYAVVDMATVIKTLQQFTGEQDEDASRWLQESTLITALANLNPEQTLSVLIMNLRGKALTWIAQEKMIHPDLQLADFIVKIKNRFSTQASTERILQEFLQQNETKTLEDYDNLLRNASTLLQRQAINYDSLFKLVIDKSPSLIRPTLYQLACASAN